MITEFGPMGPWEVDHKSDWGAAIEETSHEKAKRYLKAYSSAMNESPRYCLGAFLFIGQASKKQRQPGLGCF